MPISGHQLMKMKNKIREKLFTYYFYREPKFIYKFNINTGAFKMCLNDFANRLYKRTVDYLNKLQWRVGEVELNIRKEELTNLVDEMRRWESKDELVEKRISLYEVVIEVFETVLKNRRPEKWMNV